MNTTAAPPVIRGRRFNWKLIPLFVLCLYLTLEVITYVLICANIWRPDFLSVVSKEFAASDRPYTRFDSISGYKYTGGEPRLVNISGDSLRYDHVMHVNNKGYSSVFNYNFEKKPGITRWMVLGASYSAGEITDTTWVDLLQKSVFKDSVELYNFALEASGIYNWHNIFFQEILPSYDFDGVILAVNGDLHPLSYDMARPVFSIKHSFTDHTAIGFFPKLPKNSTSFKSNYAGLLVSNSSVYNPGDINIYENELLTLRHTKTYLRWMPVKPYFTGYLIQAVSLIENFRRFYKIYHLEDIDHRVLRGDYAGTVDYDTLFGSGNMQKVADILGYCAKNDKKIYLISMPSGSIAQLDTAFYHNNLYNRHLKKLAKEYKGHFFDGYVIFDSIPNPDWHQLRLYNEGHWNRTGIDLFLRQFIKRNELKKIH